MSRDNSGAKTTCILICSPKRATSGSKLCDVETFLNLTAAVERVSFPNSSKYGTCAIYKCFFIKWMIFNTRVCVLLRSHLKHARSGSVEAVMIPTTDVMISNRFFSIAQAHVTRSCDSRADKLLHTQSNEIKVWMFRNLSRKRWSSIQRFSRGLLWHVIQI